MAIAFARARPHETFVAAEGGPLTFLVAVGEVRHFSPPVVDKISGRE
jgi:hypothetical protein